MTGNFFIVDRRIWWEVYKLGMNPAVAYLVLARGTQRDNRLTSWSVDSIKRYTGISAERGKHSVQTLRDRMFVRQERGSTNPQYTLLPWRELITARTESSRSGHVLSPSEQRVYDSVKNGQQPSTYRRQETAKRLLANGWLYQNGNSYTASYSESDDPDLAANLIWLPNELVTGTKAGEPSPVARIRCRGDVMLLRLLVDLYHEQNLRDDGGIDRKVLRQAYDRLQVGEQGIYLVWAFRFGGEFMNWTETTLCHKIVGPNGASEFFNRLEILKEEGLLTFIPHLCESSDVQSEIIHPYGTDWTEKGLGDLENTLGRAAYQAGCAMADPRKREDAENTRFFLIAPGSSAYPNLQLVGIARLHYRPHTKRTTSWWKELQTKIPAHIEQYKQLEANAEGERAKVRRA